MQEEIVPARLRRAPRVRVFIFLGVFSGLVASLFLTLLMPSFAKGSFVAWLSVAMLLVGAGLVFFGGIALLLEWFLRKSQPVTVARQHFAAPRTAVSEPVPVEAAAEVNAPAADPASKLVSESAEASPTADNSSNDWAVKPNA